MIIPVLAASRFAWIWSYAYCYPIDTISRRMMMTSGQAKYKGSLDWAGQIIKNERIMHYSVVLEFISSRELPVLCIFF
jgi:hypothetical protein